MDDRPADTRPPRVQSVAAQRFSAGAFAGRSPQKAPRRAADLHVCPTCGSELVIPVDWAPAPNRQWRVELRCPNCKWTGGGVYSQEVVDRFDETLDIGTEAMLNDLNLLARANMEDEVERFVACIHAGNILPEDF
jgi:predicted RNA-binding Zn-ribbon protein involved in translation (DUF1610 family)